MGANVFVSGLFTWNGKALAKGKKDISSFAKSITALGRTMGVALSTAAVVNFSKTAINAFMKDEAAAKALATQLKNLGYGFATTNVEDYLVKLEKTTGVLQDHLRPAFQELLTTTGLITESQKALNTALDVSAATGMSVEQVSGVLAAGYRGQTKGLNTLGVKLSKTALTAGHMAEALKEINAAYTGQALARLETYAGKMDLLEGSAHRASITIGKGLVTALASLTTDGKITTFGTAMESAATDIANAVVGMADLIKQTKILMGLKVGGSSENFLMNIPVAGAYASYFSNRGAALQPNTGRANRTYQGGQTSNDKYVLSKKEAAAAKAAAKARAEELRLLNLKNGLENKNVEELKKKFDLERIGLTAALNQATDDETKLRLRAQLAILDNNDALAKKLLAEMEAAEALRKLKDEADKLAKAMADAAKTMGDAAEAAYKRLAVYDPVKAYGATNSSEIATALAVLEAAKGKLAGLQGAGGKIDTSNSIINGNVNPNYPGLPPALTPYDPLSSLMATSADIASAGAYNPLSGLRATAQDIQIYIDASNMIDSDRMVDVVQNAFLTIQRQGGSTVPAGAY